MGSELTARRPGELWISFCADGQTREVLEKDGSILLL
jgi:hypothetical protein